MAEQIDQVVPLKSRNATNFEISSDQMYRKWMKVQNEKGKQSACLDNGITSSGSLFVHRADFAVTCL